MNPFNFTGWDRKMGDDDSFNELTEMRKSLVSLTIEDCEFGNIIRITHESVIVDCTHKPTQTTMVAKILLNLENKELKELETEYNTLSELPPHENIITILQKQTIKFPESIIENNILDENIKSKLKDKTTIIYFLKKYSNNLEDFLFNNRQNLNSIQYHKILQSIASALLHLEKNLILHGNLNLNKFLIDEKNQKIVLCGFGFSKKMNDNSFIIEIQNNYLKYGNWIYQADEIRNSITPGMINYSKQSSFAFGIIMHEILFVHYPFVTELFFLNQSYRLKLNEDSKFKWYYQMINSLLSIDVNSRLSIENCLEILNLAINKDNEEKLLFPSYFIKDYLPSFDPEYKNLIKQANEENDKIAQYKLANLEKDVEKMIFYLHLAVENNYLPAQIMLAVYYIFHTSNNEEKVIQLLLPALHVNNPIAQYLIVVFSETETCKNLLDSFYFNENENTDEIKTKKIYNLVLQSALQKFPRAQSSLAENYFHGFKLNVKKINYLKGFYWIIQSSNQKEVKAYLILYRFYSKLVNDIDNKQTIQYCKFAAYFGDSLGQYLLAAHYLEGNFSVEKDIEKAIALFQLSAEKGNSLSQSYLGEVYYHGLHHCEKNLEKSFHFYKLAADQNLPSAQYMIASFYISGEGVDRDIVEGLKWMRLSALHNYPKAQFELGTLFYHGFSSIKQDYERAFYYFNLAAIQFYLPAIFHVASCYDFGHGVKEDKNKAFSLYKLAAVEGDVIAIFTVGYYYFMGFGVEKNVNKAVEWLRIAADKDHTQAQYYLANCYLTGDGIKRDYNEALRLFKISSDKGFSLSQCALAQIYLRNEDTRDEALRLFKLSADQGTPSAIYHIGCFYTTGFPGSDTITENYEEAFKYFKKASDLDCDEATYSLALCYANGEGVEQDIDEAIRLFTIIADTGFTKAEVELGIFYQTGNGVEKNPHKAFHLFKLAAEKGSSKAQYQLAVCYKNGSGVDKDVNEAFRLFKISADSNYSVAQFYLAVSYDNGEGVPQNKEEAIRYLRLSADQGLPRAQNYLGTCYLNGNGVEESAIQAFEWFSLAGNNGYNLAQFNLGLLCEEGVGTQKDISKAISWYTKAAKQNFSPAKEKLASLCKPKEEKYDIVRYMVFSFTIVFGLFLLRNLTWYKFR